jgi:hypothetical protein
VVTFADRSTPLFIYTIDPECEPCRTSMPFVQEIHDSQYCAVEVIGLAVANLHLLDNFLELNGTRFPVLRHASGLGWEMIPAIASPVSVLIGSEGKLEGWWIGAIAPSTQQELRQRLQSCDTI